MNAGTKIRLAMLILLPALAVALAAPVARTQEAVDQLQPGSVHEAAGKGDLERVKNLLTQHPEWLNARNANSRTPLLVAVLDRQEETAKFLLGLGADVNITDAQGLAPLLIASDFGLEDLVRHLVQKGADVNLQLPAFGMTALHFAAEGGRSGILALLLSSGARLDLRDQYGRTPLMTAAFSGRADCVRTMLDKGAALDEKDDFGNTALHLAALNGFADCVKDLVAKGAALDKKDASGNTALHLAALNGFADCVKALVAKGAALDLSNSYAGTPLSIAVREGQDEIVRILREAGAAAPASARPPALEGDYLGQKRPGMTAKLFASGVVSTEKEELNSVFTPDGKEFYFTIHTVQGPWKIMVMKRKGEEWTTPETAPFSGTWSDVDLFISPDGRRLFYCSNRPLEGEGEARQDFDIWKVERRGEGWSEPENLGAAINSPSNEFYPSVTRDGTLYFQSWKPADKAGANIYRSRLENGSYVLAEMLGEPVNTNGFEGDALISPDEGYLVYSVDRQGGFGQGDLMVSFRNADGTWTVPQNLGSAVNTKANENCPMLSPDGKYLFYTSAGDIFWVRTDVIEKLKPKSLRP